MKTILIIGGYGFLGTNILKYIEDYLKDQYRVLVIDRFPENRDGLVLDCVAKSYAGDFSDSAFVDRVFSENKIDLVIHSLSTTIPSLSFNARYDVVTNLIPTLELLNCMVRHEVKEIVYISSGGAVYVCQIIKLPPARKLKSAYGLSMPGYAVQCLRICVNDSSDTQRRP